MRCTSCRSGDLVEVTKSVSTDKDGRTALILNVPVMRCEACGEVTYDKHVAHRLDQMFAGLLAGIAEVSTAHYTAHEAQAV